LAEILGIGCTHYPPGLVPDEYCPWPLPFQLRSDPRIPEHLKDPRNWPAAMQAEWANDQGVAAHAPQAARMREAFRRLRDRMGAPEDFTVVELGAGRGEMAAALGEFSYVPVDLGGRMPDGVRGVVFSNEFFDALPVHAAVMRGGATRELRVGMEGDRFAWIEAGPAPEEVECYRKRYLGDLSDGQIFEAALESLAWLERIAAALAEGFVITIDYGYTAAELVRFPGGTLMSYRRHQALEDVLKDPGEQDITAHVCFSALQQHGKRVGLEMDRFERLAQTVMASGEADQFAAALAAGSPQDEQRRRLQLKQLLFGMGETFRTLVQRKVGRK